jgi:hypothetical protein
MAGVFQNIDPPSPSPPGEWVWGEDTLARRRGGWGVNIERRQTQLCTLYVCKYFVGFPILNLKKNIVFVSHLASPYHHVIVWGQL